MSRINAGGENQGGGLIKDVVGIKIGNTVGELIDEGQALWRLGLGRWVVVD